MKENYTVIVSIDNHRRKVTVNYKGFIGVAICAPDDAFDLRIGTELALERAKVARKNDKLNQEIYRNCCEDCDNSAEEAYDKGYAKGYIEGELQGYQEGYSDAKNEALGLLGRMG